MNDLVMYHPERDRIMLFRLGVPYYQAGQWLGHPYLGWTVLEIALINGWEVVGEL